MVAQKSLKVRVIHIGRYVEEEKLARVLKKAREHQQEVLSMPEDVVQAPPPAPTPPPVPVRHGTYKGVCVNSGKGNLVCMPLSSTQTVK